MVAVCSVFLLWLNKKNPKKNKKKKTNKKNKKEKQRQPRKKQRSNQQKKKTKQHTEQTNQHGKCNGAQAMHRSFGFEQSNGSRALCMPAKGKGDRSWRYHK